MPPREPTVTIVSVNYNGRRYLHDFLRSVLAIDYPADRYQVLIVDNQSTDDSVELLRRDFPMVCLIDAGENRGFAGGCNLGIRAARGKYVALINNDTVVDRCWLKGLIDVAEADPRVGIVGSKVVFFTPFVEVGIETQSFNPARLGLSEDNRDLGLMLFDARMDGCGYDKTIFREGCYEPEEHNRSRFRWIAGRARLAVPVNRGAETAVLALTVAGTPHIDGQYAQISIGDRVAARLPVSPEIQTVRISVDADTVIKEACDVINNVGSYLDSSGGYGDRGMYEFDRGQYNRVEDVPALCGVSMLLSQAMLKRVGLFDERFFMYFEDSDLCWRAQRAGYRLVYTPHSRVRHIHAGTSEEWSPLFTFYVTRNHLFWRVKNADAGRATRAVAAFYLRAGGALLREAMRRVRRQPSSPGGHEAATHLRLARDVARHLPGLLASRWFVPRHTRHVAKAGPWPKGNLSYR